MSDAAARVIIVAGALMQPLWVPPAEVSSRLQRLETLADLEVTDARTAAEAAPSTEALPRELAHDRWLRGQPELRDASIAPGAMAAIRRLARFDRNHSGWLIEPAHFHLAQDHLVLLADGARDLTEAHARALAEVIAPLLTDESFSLAVLGPATWLLTAGARPLRVRSAAFEAAAGRNVHGYLPTGEDAQRYRKLLNEIQMTWHDHPVNQQRESSGQLPVNSIWLSGPIEPGALKAWHEARAAGHFVVDETLLEARLRDDREAWLEALQALDLRLAAYLSSANPPRILLCGDRDCRWLQRRSRAAPTHLAQTAGLVAALARRLGTLFGGGGRAAGSPHGATIPDGLAAFFTEGTAGA